MTDSRTNGLTVRRRRTCTGCRFRFTTFEVTAHAEASSWVHIRNLVLLDKRLAADSIRTAVEAALNDALLRLIPIGADIVAPDEEPHEASPRAVPY